MCTLKRAGIGVACRRKKKQQKKKKSGVERGIEEKEKKEEKKRSRISAFWQMKLVADFE